MRSVGLEGICEVDFVFFFSLLEDSGFGFMNTFLNGYKVSVIFLRRVFG